MSAEIALQTALRARLVGNAAVIALVPASAILDSHQRPAPSPSIMLGESQAVEEPDSISRDRVRVFHMIHVWKREPSLEGAKAICGEIRTALRDGRLDLGEGYHCADWRVSGVRQLRDGDGETSHGLVTVEALVQELVP
jgi:hypothetical protein